MRKKLSALLHSAKVRAGGAAVALLCALLIALIALNLLITQLETRYGWRVDYSFNELTTTSEATLAVLETLPHPVHIYALYQRGQEDQPLMELLNRYAAASDKVTWEQVDISLNPALLTRFRGSTSDDAISFDSLIVYCEETDRFRILAPSSFVSLSINYETGAYESAGYTYERSITSAIRYVSRDVIPRALILQGHGELDSSGTELLASLLDANNYDVYYFSLSSPEIILEPGDLLLVLSPVRDLSEAELNQLVAFTRQGGSIFFTCDFTDPIATMPGWASLLRSYGFEPLEGVVIADADDRASYYNGNRMELIPTVARTDVTASLVDGRTITLLLAGCRGFALPEDSDRNLVTSAVLLSGEGSYVRSLSDGKTTLSKQDGDPEGPFALALQARRITEEGYISRAFVLGCSTALTSSDIYAMTDTQEFIIRVVEFLLDAEPADLGILAKAALRPQLSAGSVWVGTALCLGLPLAVLVLAVWVLSRRRRKGSPRREEVSKP